MTGSKRFIALVLTLALASSSAVAMSVSAVSNSGSVKNNAVATIADTQSDVGSDVGSAEFNVEKTRVINTFSSGSLTQYVTLSWAKPDTVGVHFEIWRANGSSPKADDYEQIADALSSTTYSDYEAMSSGQIYTYKIRTYTESEGVRTYGADKTITKMISGEAPNFSLKAGSITRSGATGKRPLAVLVWNKPSYTVSSYAVYVNGSKADITKSTDSTIGADKVGYTVAFPSSGVFSVKVVAFTKVGNETVQSLSLTKKFTITSAPQNVTLKGVPDSTASAVRNRISWGITELGVKGNNIDHNNLITKVERAVVTNGKAGEYTDITSRVSILADKTTYYFYDTDVDAGVMYSYRVTSGVENKDKSFVKAWNTPSTINVITADMSDITVNYENVVSSSVVRNRLYWDKSTGIKTVKIERAEANSSGNSTSDYTVLKEKFIASSTVSRNKVACYYYDDKLNLVGNTNYIYRITPIKDGVNLKPVTIKMYAKPVAPRSLVSKPVFNQVLTDSSTANVEFTLKASTSSVADMYEISLSKTSKKFVHITKNADGGIESIKVTASMRATDPQVSDCKATKISNSSFKLTFTNGGKGYTIASDPVDNIFAIRVAPVNWWKNPTAIYDQAHKVYLASNCVTYSSDAYQIKSK